MSIGRDDPESCTLVSRLHTFRTLASRRENTKHRYDVLYGRRAITVRQKSPDIPCSPPSRRYRNFLTSRDRARAIVCRVSDSDGGG